MKLLETPVWDDQWQGEEVAVHNGSRYLWLWYGYNIRLLVLPARDTPVTASTYGSMYAWCYERKGGPDGVLAALAAWDPDTQDEPPGWKKRAADVRTAPHRNPDDPVNVPRCDHNGDMLAGTCRLTVCHDTINWRARRGLEPLPFKVGV